MTNLSMTKAQKPEPKSMRSKARCIVVWWPYEVKCTANLKKKKHPQIVKGCKSSQNTMEMFLDNNMAEDLRK